MTKYIESYGIAIDMREDLMQVYREVAPNCITQFGAWRKTVNHPAKRYYVSPKQACQVLGAYFAGNEDVVHSMKPNRRDLYLSLAGEVEKLSQMPEHQGKPLSKLVSIAVMLPAPRFFISPRHMSNIYVRVKGKQYDKDGRFILQGTYPSEIRNRENYYRQRELKNAAKH